MEYLDFFKNRSTVREYSADREVDDATLRKLTEAASHAPNTGNMQLYSVVVTRDGDMKKRLAPLHFNQPQVEGCSVMLTFCVDLRRFEKWCEERDAKPGFRNFHSFVTALIDTALFAQQFVTLAELNGIGTCYLGTVTYNAREISGILELPDRVVPVLCVTAGYPAKGFGEPSYRLPVDAIFHTEKYHDPAAMDIDAMYQDIEKREDSAQFIAENGKKTLAQVFTDVRYPGNLNESVSESFAALLREKGY